MQRFENHKDMKELEQYPIRVRYKCSAVILPTPEKRIPWTRSP